jgi:superfamily I DNA/RNA helicase
MTGSAPRAVDRDRVQPGKPVVMTMHRAKGTEFARVVLIGVGAQTAAEAERLAAMDDAERADAELRARSLAYVAARRARDELVVLQRP